MTEITVATHLSDDSRDLGTSIVARSMYVAMQCAIAKDLAGRAMRSGRAVGDSGCVARKKSSIMRCWWCRHATPFSFNTPFA